jgi:hypothetical protein
MKKKVTEWKVCYGFVSESRIQDVQEIIGLSLPKKYLQTIENCDAGVPMYSDFIYIDADSKETMYGSIGGYLNINKSEWSDFIELYQSPPEFFPKGLVAFAETGGGDLICFDYREGKDNPNPPIVYWNHEAQEGKDVSFIAKDFEAFLDMLQEPED